MEQLYTLIDPDKDKRFESKMRRMDPESKQYLICIASNSPEVSDYWEICTGRTEARDFIKDNIDVIDFEKSFVLVETVSLNERKSIHAFMKHIEPFYNDGFDIEEYIRGDFSEKEYQTNNGIDPMFSSDIKPLTAEELLGGISQTTTKEANYGV